MPSSTNRRQIILAGTAVCLSSMASAAKHASVVGRSPRFVINGTIQVRVSDIPEFIRSSNVVAAQTLEEPGCVYYYMGQGLADPKLFHLSEGWADEAAHEAHLLTPHFKLAMREVAAITLEAVTMKRYSVTAAKDLSHIALPER